jgi:hypothetical protein
VMCLELILFQSCGFKLAKNGAIGGNEPFKIINVFYMCRIFPLLSETEAKAEYPRSEPLKILLHEEKLEGCVQICEQMAVQFLLMLLNLEPNLPFVDTHPLPV